MDMFLWDQRTQQSRPTSYRAQGPWEHGGGVIPGKAVTSALNDHN